MGQVRQALLWDNRLVTQVPNVRVLLLAVTILSVFVSSCTSKSATQPRSAPVAGNDGNVSTSTSITDPPNVLYFTMNGTVEFRSPVTGILVKTLDHLGNLVGNGASLSPDGKNAYVSVMDKGDLGTERIQTTTAKTSFAVDGIEAAVSANGSYLAYTPGPKYESILSVKNLATGAISTIDLEPLLGSSTDLSNATITWLGDGSEIVVMPSGIATPVNASDSSSPTSGPTGGSNKATCSASLPRTSVCLVLVHFTGSNQSLTARQVVVNGVGGNLNVVSAAQSQPRTLALAAGGERTMIYWITFSGQITHVTHLATMGMVLPVSFDALGTHLLYVVGHGPVSLWVTGFRAGHLVNEHRLLNSIDMSGATW